MSNLKLCHLMKLFTRGGGGGRAEVSQTLPKQILPFRILNTADCVSPVLAHINYSFIGVLRLIT